MCICICVPRNVAATCRLREPHPNLMFFSQLKRMFVGVKLSREAPLSIKLSTDIHTIPGDSPGQKKHSLLIPDSCPGISLSLVRVRKCNSC